MRDVSHSSESRMAEAFGPKMARKRKTSEKDQIGKKMKKSMRLKFKDQSGDTYLVGFEPHYKMGSLFNAYADYMHQPVDIFRSMHEGERIDAQSTVGQNHFENDDQIDVMVEQTGGSKK